jgi:hypothetical protein
MTIQILDSSSSNDIPSLLSRTRFLGTDSYYMNRMYIKVVCYMAISRIVCVFSWAFIRARSPSKRQTPKSLGTPEISCDLDERRP